MKAFIVDRYKSKDGLRFGDMPDPELRDGDVRVQVHAASVNPLDPRSGTESSSSYCPIACRSFWGTTWPGSSSGWGPKCEDFEPGDKVYGRPNQDRIGTFAEFISMNEADLALKPR